MTKTIDVPKSWWDNFTNEPICEDASDPNTEDECLQEVWLLLNTPPVKELKNARRLAATPDVLIALYTQAKWYSYYWGEACSDSAWDAGERLGWVAKGRSSMTLARKALEMLDEMERQA